MRQHRHVEEDERSPLMALIIGYRVFGRARV
jgi:hypothetical protein